MERLGRPPHIGVGMDRKDDGDVLSQCDPCHCLANSREPAVEAFAAVARHQDYSFVLGEMSAQYSLDPRPQLRLAIQQSGHPQQCVDPGIARDDDPGAADSLAQKVVTGPGGRSKVKVGYLTDEPAVNLLRPRRIDVGGAQTGLDMRYWDS